MRGSATRLPPPTNFLASFSPPGDIQVNKLGSASDVKTSNITCFPYGTGLYRCQFTADGNPNVATRLQLDISAQDKTTLAKRQFEYFRVLEYDTSWPSSGTTKFPNSTTTPGLAFDLTAPFFSTLPDPPSAANLNYYASPDAYPSGSSGTTYQSVYLQPMGCPGSAYPCSTTISGYKILNNGGAYKYSQIPAVTTITQNGPTAVRMKDADAVAMGRQTVVRWRTGNEVDNLGFRVYRDVNGRLSLVTPELIAGSALIVGPNMPLSSGQNYRVVDPEPVAGARYWVEEVDLDGTTKTFGPIDPVTRGKARLELEDDAGRLVSSPSLADAFRSAAPPVDNPGFGAVTDVAARPAAAEALLVVAADQNRQFALAAAPGMKVLVSKEGWYRFTRNDLAKAGWDPGSKPANLQLYAEGQPVAMNVTSLAGGNYAMEFYGTGLDTPATGTRVYWLALGDSAGSRVDTASTAKAGTPAPTDFPYTVERKDRVIYVPAIVGNGDAENWFGPLVGPPGFPVADQPVQVSHVNLASAATSTLEVALQGFTTGVSHDVDVSVNGKIVGSLSFADQVRSVARLDVPTSLLKEGVNSISLAGRAGGGYSLVDYVRLTYPHSFDADSDALAFTVDRNTTATVSGFTSADIRVFDVTDPTKVLAVPASVSGSGPYSVTVTAPGSRGAHRLLALAGGRIASPESYAANVPSSLNKKNNGADFVIVSHPSLIPALAPLQALRQSQGLATRIVDVTDVYDEFSFGEKDPAALKSFLQLARSSWKTPPRYVLLAGDGSLDPRNYLGPRGFAYSDFIPVKLVSAGLKKAASDDWFVDFDGDSMPDLPVGRLPVDTPAEAQAVVAKITGYEQSRAGSGVLLAADRNDSNDFAGAVDGLAPLVVGRPVQTVKVAEVGAAEAASRIVSGFNSGVSLVNWVGHGQPTYWSKSDVFGNDEALALKNSWQLPVVLTMDCQNGAFEDPTTLSLAEALLEAPNGGAAAVWASSALTLFESQVPVNRAAFEKLFGPEPVRIGDAFVYAKSATTDRDVRRSWILFGDPTMIFK